MSFWTPLKVPVELQGVARPVLENYVHSRILQFISGLGQRMLQLSPEQVDRAVLDRAVRDVLDALPLPDYGLVPLEMLDLQLVFRHDCLALGCTEPQCVLCQDNPQRRCTVNFTKKYLVNDRMVARCGAPVRVEVVDRAAGKLCDAELPDVYLQLFILDGTQYDQKFTGDTARAAHQLGAGGQQADADLDSCAVLMNNKSQPLVSSLTGTSADEKGRLLLHMQGGRVVLPDVVVTDSSEALMTGRKPPFRLVVRARHTAGLQLKIRHAVSEPFVVATRRVKASHKVEIPSTDDPVSKLDHMGRETVRKLMDLPAAAAQAGVALDLGPELHHIEKVKEFKALALKAESQGHLRQQLQALLKLPKDKWDEAAEHAKRAVVPDNRMRAWYADRTMTLGLLFPCRLGAVDLQRPEALLQRTVVVCQAHQSPMQRDAVRQLLPQAVADWWQPGHLGWTIFPGAETVLQTGTFEANVRSCTVFDLPMHGDAPPIAQPCGDIAAAGAAATATAAATAAAAGPLGPPVTANMHMHGLAATGGAATTAPTAAGPPLPLAAATAVAVAAEAPEAGFGPLASDGLELAPPGVPMAYAPGLAPQAALSLGSLVALLQSAVEAAPEPAAPAAAAAAGEQAEQLDTVFAVHHLQQLPAEQQQQQQDSVLPSAAGLDVMLQTHSLTPDVAAAIEGAYKSNSCPSDILAVLCSHVSEGTAPTAAAVPGGVGEVPAAAAGTGVRSGSPGSPDDGSNRCQPAPAPGQKRNRLAAAFSAVYTADAGSCGVAGAVGAAALVAHGGSMLGTSGKRPASFSGAVDLQRVAAATAADHNHAQTVGCRPSSCNIPLSMAQQVQLQQLDAAAVAAAVDGAAAHPFCEHLQRGGAGSCDRGSSLSDGGSRSAFEGAVETAARALVDFTAAAQAAGAGAASSRPAEDSTLTIAGAGNFAGPDSQAGVHRSAAGASLTTQLGPDQGLDVAGLDVAYPSALLADLAASAAAAAAGHTSATGSAADGGSSTEHGSGSTACTDIQAARAHVSTPPDMEVHPGDSALPQVQVSSAAALQPEAVNNSGLLRSLEKVIAPTCTTGVTAGNSGGNMPLRFGPSVDMMDGMSLELPSMLLSDSLAIGEKLSGERSGLGRLSLSSVFGKSALGDGFLCGAQQMSLELPSCLLSLSCSDVGDTAAARDAGTGAGTAAANSGDTSADGLGAFGAAAAAEAVGAAGLPGAAGSPGWDILGGEGNTNSGSLLCFWSGSNPSGGCAGASSEREVVLEPLGQALEEIISMEGKQV